MQTLLRTLLVPLVPLSFMAGCGQAEFFGRNGRETGNGVTEEPEQAPPEVPQETTADEPSAPPAGSTPDAAAPDDDDDEVDEEPGPCQPATNQATQAPAQNPPGQSPDPSECPAQAEQGGD